MKNIEVDYSIVRDGEVIFEGYAPVNLTEKNIKEVAEFIKDNHYSGELVDVPSHVYDRIVAGVTNEAFKDMKSELNDDLYESDEIRLQEVLPVDLLNLLPEDVLSLIDMEKILEYYPQEEEEEPTVEDNEDTADNEDVIVIDDSKCRLEMQELDEEKVFELKVPRALMVAVSQGQLKKLKIELTPDNENDLIEFEEVEEDGEMKRYACLDEKENSVPIKYDVLHLYSKSPDGAHVKVAVTNTYAELERDENGNIFCYELEDGTTFYAEHIFYELGEIIENDINPGKRTEAYEGPFLKCLATQQPWAQLIVTGIKDIECRRALPAKPGKVFIAASGSKLKWDELHPMVQEIYSKYEKKGVLPAYSELPTKCIVGYVDIVKASTDPVESIWGRDHDGMKYTLRNAMVLDEPIYGKNKATPYFYNVEGYDEDHLPVAHQADLSE